MSRIEKDIGQTAPDVCGADGAKSGGEGSALADLLARVEAATGPDRALDAAIEHEMRFQRGLQLGLKPKYIAIWRHVGNGFVESQGTRYAAPPYTASLDAALALVERVLPGWLRWIDEHFDDDAKPFWMATLVGPTSGMAEAEAKTAPLALLAALLKALSTTPKDSIQSGNEEVGE